MSSTPTTYPALAHAQTSGFSSVPVLDYSLISSPSTKPLFISQLQHALINVGFLYLSNHTVPTSTIDFLVDYIPKLFALPQEEKEKMWMVHSPHFLGYSRLGAERTSGNVDHMEQFEFGTRHETRWREGGEEAVPEYWKMWGPSQVCLICVSSRLHPLTKSFLFLLIPVARRVCLARLPCHPGALLRPSPRPRVRLRLPPRRILFPPSRRAGQVLRHERKHAAPLQDHQVSPCRRHGLYKRPRHWPALRLRIFDFRTCFLSLDPLSCV